MTDEKSEMPEVEGTSDAEAAGTEAPDEQVGDSTTQAREPEPSRIPPLPSMPDLEGAGWERPTTKGAAYMALFVVSMWGIAALCWWAGGIPIAIILIVLPVVLLALLLVQSKRAVQQLLARCDGSPLTADEQAALESGTGHDADVARRVERLGTLLGREGTGAMATFSASLDPDEAATVERNRAAESDASWEWAKTAPDFQTVETASDDGCHLTAHVLCCNPESDHWVVFAHGYHGDWTEGMLHARHYAERGFNVLLVEMRGHASSGGELVGMGYPDRRDLVAWVEWLVSEKGEDVRVVLHGHSMGGASVCMAAGEPDLPSQVCAVVSDCAYCDMWNEVAAILSGGMHIPAHPMLDAMRLSLKRLPGGYDVVDVSAERAVAHAQAPILVIHGEADTFVAPYMATRIADACGGKAAGDAHDLVLVPSAAHCQSCLADPDRYYSSLFGFVGRYL